ncbi:MAG: murein biosynthesis integral membrane protein MurJ [Caldilineales bacterium]|nr:murein biosynthesis integral membrane protein MurJ [Caldilineales bacterium]
MSQGEGAEERGASVARSAVVLSLGSVLSRVLGLVREIVIPHYYGATGMVSAFRVSEFVVRTLYDLLIGGMLTAALVPVLSDYARPERRHEFARVASAIFTVMAGIAAVAMLVLELAAPFIVSLLGGDLDPIYQTEAVRLMRLSAPAVWMFTSAGVLAAILFSRQRFTMVALGDALYNMGIIVCVPLLYQRLGILALAVGILIGSLIQLGFRLPDLRGVGLRLTREFRHPALRRVWKLYLPIFLALIVGMIQGAIDTRLATSTGDASLAYMRTATTFYQFPHGLVAVAISMASLPTLSRWAAAHDWSAYRHTLGSGLRAVLVLVVPATIALWVLAEPTIRLVAQHGAFTAEDTYWTALALRFYLFGLIFASIDWPLNFSFYARSDSRTPAIVGVISVGVYLVVALSLLNTLSFLGLALADGVKHFAHAMIMIALLYRWGGRLHQGVVRTGVLTLAAGLVMGVVVWATAAWLLLRLGTEGLGPRLAVVLIPGIIGTVVYYLMLRMLHVSEVELLNRLAQRATRVFRR